MLNAHLSYWRAPSGSFTWLTSTTTTTPTSSTTATIKTTATAAIASIRPTNADNGSGTYIIIIRKMLPNAIDSEYEHIFS